MRRLLQVLSVLPLLLLGGCAGPFIEAGMFGDEIKAGLEKYKLEQANLQRLKDTKKCPNCELQEINLGEASLQDADLKGAQLKQAHLKGANLENADLKGANLQGAYLQRANLQGAFLYEGNLQNAFLRGANLTGADLRETNFKWADLRDVDLRGANLKWANLTGAILEGAKLKGANFEGVIIDNKGNKIAIASGAKNVPEPLIVAKKRSPKVNAEKKASFNPKHLKRLKETNKCPECNLKGVNLEGTNLVGAKLWDAYFVDANLKGANLNKASLFRANFWYANLQGANLEGANLKAASFIGVNLRNANLQKADLRNANLQKADLRNADLRGADLEGAKLDPKGIKIAKATGALNVPEAVVVAKKTPPTKRSSLPYCKGSPTSSVDTAKNWTGCLGTASAAGAKYIGEWKNGAFHGKGTFVGGPKFSGDKYVGQFRNGTKNGQGTYTFAKSGDKYVGEFTDNKIHGQGNLTFANGDKYVGEFKDGKRHGQATFTVGNLGSQGEHAGGRYVGEYKDDEKHGQGTYTWASGDKYVGEHKDGKSHGQGTYTYANGNKYVGEWKDGLKHGKGIATFGSTSRFAGDKYVGEFKSGYQNGQGLYIYANGRIKEGIFENGKFLYAKRISPAVIANILPTPRVEEKLKPSPKSETSGSGFFISKLGHVITNEHVVRNCKRISVGENTNKQNPVELVAKKEKIDLALLKMTSEKTKSLVVKLGIKVVPLASKGLLRSDDVELGEKVMVAGYPYGDVFSDTIKVTFGNVSATRGMGDDSGQFQLSAPVQPGNSGGPIYDENGNIVGVVISQLNKLKVAKAIGSFPENVNFGIKASTIRRFLTSSGLPTKWSTRSKIMPDKELAKIAQKQTLMVMCHQ